MAEIKKTWHHEAANHPLAGSMKRNVEARAKLRVLIDAHRHGRPGGSILKLEGDTCQSTYVLISGWIAVSKSTRDGHRQIIDIILPGEILDANLGDPERCAVQIEALSDVNYAAVPHFEWRRLRHAAPEIVDAVDQVTSAILLRMSEHLLRLGKGSAASMIAFALCELCIRTSPSGLIEGETYHIPMTQLQLGDFCGLSAVHVCRTLRRFKRNGLLETADHMDIVIRDLDALAEHAEIDPYTLRRRSVPAA
jgi:CRP-like cAMP-binding protein